MKQGVVSPHLIPNIALVAEDLAALSPAHGDFDYVIAHGVYSWVPAAVRDGLFALAARRLAPNGVMFVSYNALPGCRVRQATWDVLHWHVDTIADPRARHADGQSRHQRLHRRAGRVEAGVHVRGADRGRRQHVA